MRFDIVTILPELFEPFLKVGVGGRAFKNGVAEAVLWNPRDYATDRHRTVDDRPFGGGSGMVLMAPPVSAAVRAAQAQNSGEMIYLAPRGDVFNDAVARRMATQQGFILLCGRYRGVDERVIETLADRCISVGDYVLSGGETAAMTVMDAVLRHCPGVLGNADSIVDESFADGLLDAPCYTRPATFEGLTVPAPLLSGNHAEVHKWQRAASEKLTQQCRPDLSKKHKDTQPK
ncbi:tRNA (guanosine(37)-N1)-methyltransferase TrmD [Candidatus Persebacteraceae bacterium Df01]|jgi:tRNA (guanine37-N1)-methyltransferase|uniref:tRNA (guanine-N(1)-)-methyltransferase n=1 Tax=Candidatus Doriopsillibacter californiensis TaxID=2970740 RepID=A0ABT7QL88_9GAMM|nr:tRNA (guanosine(37)-N1)-methyltransferase TrmD [Candidatus Persebacteraceae bacterium Df01]